MWAADINWTTYEQQSIDSSFVVTLYGKQTPERYKIPLFLFYLATH